MSAFRHFKDIFLTQPHSASELTATLLDFPKMPPNYHFDAAIDQENIDPKSHPDLDPDESDEDLSQPPQKDVVDAQKPRRTVQPVKAHLNDGTLDKQTPPAKDSAKGFNLNLFTNLDHLPDLSSQEGISRTSPIAKSAISESTESPNSSQKIANQQVEDNLDDDDDELETPISSADASDHGQDDVLTGSTQKQSQPKAKRRKTTGDARANSMPATSRGLRERKPVQLNPYMVDRIAVKAQKSKGRNPTEAEVKKELGMTQTRPKQSKKQRVRRSIEVSVTSDESDVEVVELDPAIKLQRTVLRLTVPGEKTGVEVPFTKINTLPELIDWANRRWGAVKGSTVEYLVCKRPWLEASGDEDLLIYEDWDDQFDALVSSIVEAQVWRTMSDEQKLKVMIEAALMNAEAPEMTTVATPQSNV
jgi:hypothetical protein